MAKEKSSKYYDSCISEAIKNEHRYEELYKLSSTMMITEGVDTLIDLGCGIGGFVKFIPERIKKYIGIDFSKKLIEYSKEKYPNHTFINMSVFHEDSQKIMKENNLFLCLEVLEHLEKDIELIQLIPSGSIFIFSVPNIDGHGHVRSFKKFQDVIDRYNKYLKFLLKIEITKKDKPHHIMFLSKTIKK